MSKKTTKKANEKNKKSSKHIVATKTKPDGTEEYYITTAPQKTIGGKIIIWILVILMALGTLGSLIIALVQILGK